MSITINHFRSKSMPFYRKITILNKCDRYCKLQINFSLSLTVLHKVLLDLCVWPKSKLLLISKYLSITSAPPKIHVALYLDEPKVLKIRVTKSDLFLDTIGLQVYRRQSRRLTMCCQVYSPVVWRFAQQWAKNRGRQFGGVGEGQRHGRRCGLAM